MKMKAERPTPATRKFGISGFWGASFPDKILLVLS